MTCLNLGSGQRCFPGWVNIDAISRPPDQIPDLICNLLTDPLPYENDSVDLIVLWHVLEHFGCGEGDGLLRECYRVLKLSGSLIIAVPDLRALAQRWLTRQIDDYIYFVNLMGAFQSADTDRHKWHYSRESLDVTLRSCGNWSELKPFDFRRVPGMDVCSDWWYFTREAVK